MSKTNQNNIYKKNKTIEAMKKRPNAHTGKLNKKFP